MKTILVTTLVLAAQVSWAQTQDISEARKSAYEKMEACGNAVYSDSQWLVSSLPNTANGIGHVRITSLTDAKTSYDFPAQDAVVDVKVKDGNVYVLTETTFEAWNIKTQKSVFQYASHPAVNKNSHWSQKANGFVLSGNQVFIAHGTLGFSILNLQNGAVNTVIPMPTESSAQDIDLLDANTAVAAIDNADDGQFRGLYLLDLKSMQITKQIKIDNAYPLSIRVLSQNRLMVGYLNAIWKFDLQGAISATEAQPNRRSWVFPGLQDVDMRGKVFYDDKYMYSCFYEAHYDQTGMGRREPHPMAFKLDDLKLN